MTFAVYVPSRSRFSRSLTLDAIKGADRDFTVYLVVPFSQRESYVPLSKEHRVKLLSCPVDGIAKTRHFCGKHANQMEHDRFIMIDDDLRFYHRTSMTDFRLTKNTPEQTVSAINLLAEYLVKYAHGSIDIRQGNNSRNNEKKYPVKVIGRMLRVLGYQTVPFLASIHGRVPVMEDFDVTLQLLRRGYPNIILTDQVQDQQQTQLPGGCSDYRDHAKQEAAAHELKRLHPAFVELVEKNNSTGGAFGKRTDVRISWEGALKSAKS